RHQGEPVMPPEGDAIPNEEITVLEAWIQGGLLENNSSKAKKPPKPSFDPTLVRNPQERPSGPPPMPQDLSLEPIVVTERAGAIHAMAVSPWAPLLAVTGHEQILLFQTTTLELVGVLPFPHGEPVSLSFTPNGRYLIAGGGIPGKSGTTVTYDVISGKTSLTAGQEFDSILCADLSPDLSLVATGSPSKRIKLWASENASLRNSIKKHTDWVTDLDISGDGILLATGDRNGGAWVWETQRGTEFHTLRGHQAAITEIAFRSDSNLLASASEDGTVRFWEMNRGQTVKKLDAHKPGVLAFSWGRDGSFVTAGRDHTAKLWKSDFSRHRTISKLPDIPTAVALDSDHCLLFVAHYQGLIEVYDTEHGKSVGTLDNNPPRLASRLANLTETKNAHHHALQTAQDNLHLAETRHSKATVTHQQLAAHLTHLKGKLSEGPISEEPPRGPKKPAQKTEHPTTLSSQDLEATKREITATEKRLARARKWQTTTKEQARVARQTVRTLESESIRLAHEERHWTRSQLKNQLILIRSSANELQASIDTRSKELSRLLKANPLEKAASTLETQLNQDLEKLRQLQHEVTELETSYFVRSGTSE
ncbi:MAG: hypothetical protein ACQKBU_02020, partial [Verrucomicrobiales bacterium]